MADTDVTDGHEHGHAPFPEPSMSAAAYEHAAGIFRAVGDVERLRLLDRLAAGERCVTELADAAGTGLSTVSQRLRVLRAEGLVARRRHGKHVYYSLADGHVAELVRNALAHAGEGPPQRPPTRSTTVTHHEHDHATHHAHDHAHGAGCGHAAVTHDEHTDYAHDGHLHHPHDEHVDEHTLPASDRNPADCTPDHDCTSHDTVHAHDLACGHPAIPHADHTDYLVDGHLHHPHESHCDSHGAVAAV